MTTLIPAQQLCRGLCSQRVAHRAAAYQDVHVLAALLGRHFWITGYAMLTLGFVLPGDWSWLRPSIPVLLGGILFFSSLKIRLGEAHDAVRHLSTWRRLSVMVLLKLFLIPLVVLAVTWLIAPKWAHGLFLVAMMPAGFVVLAFTDLLRGDRVIALLFILAASACVPVTVPLLLLAVTGKSVDLIAVAEKTGYIAVLLLTPFVLAQLTRWWFPRLVQRHYNHWNAASIASGCLLIFVGSAVNRASWKDLELSQLGLALGLTIVATVVSALCALIASRWMRREDAIAFTCGAIYMNNGLAMAFATQFYPANPYMILPTIVVQLPIMIGVPLVNWYMERKRKTLSDIESTHS